MAAGRRIAHIGASAAAAATMIAAAAAADAPAPARQNELLHLLKHDCGSCHGLTMRGGLGPPLLRETLADKPDAALAEAILDGRPGSAMPPWAFALTAAEAAWLIERLRQGALE